MDIKRHHRNHRFECARVFQRDLPYRPPEFAPDRRLFAMEGDRKSDEAGQVTRKVTQCNLPTWRLHVKGKADAPHPREIGGRRVRLRHYTAIIVERIATWAQGVKVKSRRALVALQTAGVDHIVRGVQTPLFFQTAC